MQQFFINVLVTRWHYVFLALVEIALFIVYYYIISPSNFGSFSITLRYYLSALGTLLAVVVSFNTLVIQNQLKNMPTDIKSMENQLNKIQSFLDPVFNKSKSDSDLREETTDFDGKKQKANESDIDGYPSLYYSNAIKSMIIFVKDRAMSYMNDNESSTEQEKFTKICKSIFEECNSKLSTYNKTKSVYNLLTISTTEYIQKMRFSGYSSKNNKEFYQIFQKLHLLKSICYRIYIRNMLTDLSYELLASTIPIITFIGLISSISNYENYNIFLIRVLFATSISVAAIPFLLLFIRILPILHLVKEASTIPFARKK